MRQLWQGQALIQRRVDSYLPVGSLVRDEMDFDLPGGIAGGTSAAVDAETHVNGTPVKSASGSKKNPLTF